MKKFTLLMAAALMGTAAVDAATVYFENTGNWASVNVWQWGGSDANNVDGTWPGNLTLSETATKDGKTYFKHETQCSSIIFINGSNDSQKTGDLTVIDNMIYNANGATGESFTGGEIVVDRKVHLAGEFNRYNGMDPDYQFTTTDNVNYTFSLAGPFSSDFAIVVTDANTIWYKTPDKVVSGEEYILISDGMTNCTLAKTPATDLTFNFNIETKTMKVTYTSSDEPGPQPGTDYTKWYLNVQGDFNSWIPAGVKFNAEGVATSKNLAIGTGEFEIKIYNGTNDVYYGDQSNAVVPGVETQLYEGGGHMTISGAAEGDIYDVTYNCATNMILVTKVGGGDDPRPEVKFYYSCNTSGAAEWTFNHEMTKNSQGNFEADVTTTADTNYFTFTTGLMENWTVTDGERYGAGASDVECALNNTYPMTAGSDKCFTVGKGNWLFVINPATNELTVSAGSGVEAIEAEEGNAVYYNLQGVRVDNPENGIFIRVANGKSVKVAK